MLGIAFMAEHYLRISLESDRLVLTNKLRSTLEEQQRDADRNWMWYGTVLSVSIEDGALTIDFKDKFVASGAAVTMRVLVTPSTKLAKQTLLASDGLYVGFSEEEHIDLTDIRRGDRISARMHTNEDGRAVADVLIVGGAL